MTEPSVNDLNGNVMFFATDNRTSSRAADEVIVSVTQFINGLMLRYRLIN